ncbi:MAG: AAA family ATPase [Nitrospinae bacterium]|nr:AAA family ATPase [Nitrospinota bacterium]
MLEHQAMVGLLGPRQAGKTTLALQIAAQRPSVYFDLESTTDMAKLINPELYLQQFGEKLVILDEIQRKPGIFQSLRGIIIPWRRTSRSSTFPPLPKN